MAAAAIPTGELSRLVDKARNGVVGVLFNEDGTITLTDGVAGGSSILVMPNRGGSKLPVPADVVAPPVVVEATAEVAEAIEAPTVEEPVEAPAPRRGIPRRRP